MIFFTEVCKEIDCLGRRYFIPLKLKRVETESLDLDEESNVKPVVRNSLWTEFTPA